MDTFKHPTQKGHFMLTNGFVSLEEDCIDISLLMIYFN